MDGGPLCPHNDAYEECDTVGSLHLCGYCANAWHFECLPREHQALVSGTFWKCQECQEEDASAGAAGVSSSALSSVATRVGPEAKVQVQSTAQSANSAWQLLPGRCTKLAPPLGCIKSKDHIGACDTGIRG